MSPRIALLILVLGSAAAFKKSSLNFGGMISSLMENNLAMAMALSRLPPDEMSVDGSDQLRNRSTSPLVGECKHIFNTRKQVKVSSKLRKDAIEKKTQDRNNRHNDLIRITKRTHLAMTLQGPHEALCTPRFLVNSFQQEKKEQDKEESKLFSFKTAIIKQAVHKALKGGLHIPRFLSNNFQQKWGETAGQKNRQEKINRLNERLVAELPKYWFKICTKCPKHTWFLKNLEEKEAAAEEAVRTTVIKQVILQAMKGGLTPQPNNQQMQRNIEEKAEAAAEAVITRIIKQAVLQALKGSLSSRPNNQQMQRNLKEKTAAAAEAVITRIIKQAALQALKGSLSSRPNNQQMQRNLEEKKAAAAETVITRVIKQAVLQALRGSLTPRPNNAEKP